MGRVGAQGSCEGDLKRTNEEYKAKRWRLVSERGRLVIFRIGMPSRAFARNRGSLRVDARPAGRNTDTMPHRETRHIG